MLKKYFLLLICLTCFNEMIAQIPEPSGRRLRAIVEDKFSDGSIIIGATTGSWSFALGTNTGQILDREFSYVTPENDFKQSVIHPSPATWNWDMADLWLQHIIDNNQIVRIHSPIGPQCSDWAKDDSRTAEELETNLREFLIAVCQRYNGKPGIKYMDVVNETVVKGQWNVNRPGIVVESPWYKIGQDNDINETPLYIGIAFEIAKQYAPDIKLIYNQHGDLRKLNDFGLIAETIRYLRNKGLRVDGIGWQAHIDSGWETPENLLRLRTLIDSAHSNALEFHITEASVWLKNGNSPEALEQQAATYRAVVEVLLEKRFGGKVGWNIWHIDDGHGWHPEWYASLFDTNYTAKPAYYAIQSALESAAPSSVPGNSNQILPNVTPHPNPFSESTTINYELSNPGRVAVKVYDMLGNVIAEPVDEYQDKGTHSCLFDAAGHPDGMYYYTVRIGDRIESGKMVLVR